MRLFKRKQGVERATPEISKRFLEQTKARDKVIEEVVARNSRRIADNHLGAGMQKALGAR